MAIGSPLIVSIVSLQHIFLLTVHPAAALALQHLKTAHKLIDRNQTDFSSATSIALPSVVRNRDLQRVAASAEEEEVGTDQGLYNAGLFEGDIQLQPTHKNAISDDLLLWPLAAVPYTIDDSIGCPDSWRCTLLMDAMDHIQQSSCVRFKEWTSEPNKINVFLNPERGACWSPVGRTGYETQNVSLGADCWHKGIVLHELLHSVGFWHEMNRPDRDAWIYIYWGNILQGFSSAFYKQDEHEVDTLGERFDYRSVMMYDEYAFSKDGVSVTLRAKNQNVVIGPIWQKKQLSRSDVLRIHKLYSCRGNQNLLGFPYNEICSFEKDTCGYVNAASTLWRWQRTQSSGYLYVDLENWTQVPAVLQSVNFHALNTGRSEIGCLRFTHYSKNWASRLTVKVVYLQRATDQYFDSNLVQTLWKKSSSLNGWNYAEVPLYVHRPFKIIFEGSFENYASDGALALDDIELYYYPCTA